MNTESSSSQERLERTESLSISPEVFEKLYLSPKNAVAGDLRKTFGNPTPVFVLFRLIWIDTEILQRTGRLRRRCVTIIRRTDGLERRNRFECNHVCNPIYSLPGMIADITFLEE
jgi:hypothetical protein